MLDTKCSQYWGIAEYLPLDAVLDYWCDGQEYDCRNAKKYALIGACERRDVLYARTDGKTFNDPILELIGRNMLIIHRESFQKWADVSFASVEKQDYLELLAERDNLKARNDEVEGDLNQLKEQWTKREAEIQKTIAEKESTRSIETLQKIIIAVAIDSYGYAPAKKGNSAVTDIRKALNAVELDVSENTIRKHLEAGAQLIPQDTKA